MAKPHGPRVNFTALPGFIKPTYEMKAKAKAALGIPNHMKLPRCMAKRKMALRHLEGHDAPDHICDDCRCRFVAGYGTSHYGVGYCIVHEHDPRYRGHARRVMEAHKVAIQQGYPDKAYKYAVADPDGYVAEIRKAAEDARGVTDLREEIVLVRSELQRMLKEYEGGNFKVRVGSPRDGFEYVQADDMERSKALNALVRSLSRISVDNLRLTEDEMVSKDKLKVWAAGTISIVERMSPDKRFRDEFVEQFAKLFEDVNG